jgi:hypothetical protein
MFATLQISRAPHISKSQSNRGMRSRIALIAMMPTFRNARKSTTAAARRKRTARKLQTGR